MKRLTPLLVLLTLISTLNAQTTDLGNPIGWNDKVPSIKDPVFMPGFDIGQCQLEDEINDANKVGPWRFGYEFEVDLGLDNSGDWYQLPNGDRMWRLNVISTGALTMNFIFDKYVLPEGAYLMLYPSDRSYHHNAYTAANNNEAQVLGTALIKGDDVVIEYYEPAEVAGQGQLHLFNAIHGYRSVGFFQDDMEKALNSSGDCNIDVLCPLGVGWEQEVKSVAMIVSGGGLCTGALVNNTAEDGTPYFLTADHCGHNAAWSFQFNWISPNPSCATTANSTNGSYDEINGSQLRASNGGSDFALFELNSTPPASYGIVYAGWDKSDATTVTETTGIHHPSGDIMKICRDNDAPYHSTSGGAQVWWIDEWEEGVTEPGSSGSPLFDQNHRIIGQLYGGAAACSGTSNNGQYDFYGRFGVSWNGSNSSSRLRDWLDPTGSNPDYIDAYDPNAAPTAANDAGISGVGGPSGLVCGTSITPDVTLKNYGANNLTSVDILYNIDGGANSTYNWTGTLAPNATVVVTLPTISLGGGTHTFNVTTDNPNAVVDSDPSNDTGTSSFVLGPINMEVEIITDCWGSETTWSITDPSGSQLFTEGGPYADVSGGTTETHNFCLPAGCYRFEILDSYGDGMYGSQYGSCSVDGNYTVRDLSNSGTPVIMLDPDFGNGITHDFCIPSVGLEDESPLDQVRIFPNPAASAVSIFLPFESATEIKLMDLSGKLLLTGMLAPGVRSIDLSDCASGAYLIRIQYNGYIKTSKLLKH